MTDNEKAEPGGPARILIVDDNSVIRKVVEAKLIKSGYVVAGANSGTEALTKLAPNFEADADPNERFDLVLLDIEMPGRSGIEVLKPLRSRVSAIDLPVIMVTSRDSSEDVVRALKSGANDYVTKSIDFPVLLARIATHVALKRSHEELRNTHRSLVHVAKMESVIHLAGGVAHEIRRPLAQVEMGLTAVQSALPQDGSDLPAVVERMKRSLKEADSIVSKLISYSTSHRLRLEPVDLNQFVVESLALLEEQFARCKVSIDLQIARSSTIGMIAREELRQVLINILLNALQAMPEGGTITVRTGERRVTGVDEKEAARIGAHVRNSEPAATIEIEDSGPGITDDELQRVFDPFFTGSARGKGPGLGLTVARKMVSLHGGVIRLKNKTFGHGLNVTMMFRCKPRASV